MKKKRKQSPRPLQIDSNWHKQSSEVLRLGAYTVGKDRENADLFTIPGYIDQLQQNVTRTKMTLSAFRLNLLLIKLLTKPGLCTKEERNGEVVLVLRNMGLLEKELEAKHDKVRTWLLQLGGFKYPDFSIDSKDEITLTYKNYVSIEWKYKRSVLDQFEVQIDPNTGEETPRALRIGTQEANYILGETPDRIEIVFSKKLTDQINTGTGKGYVYTSDDLVKETRDMTPTAFKLLMFSGANDPNRFKITLKNLCKDLGLATSIKTQGKPRLIETILKGLNELKEKGHVTEYQYDSTKEVFKWKLSSKYFNYAGVPVQPEIDEITAN